jgi:hypothetical protein
MELSKNAEIMLEFGLGSLALLPAKAAADREYEKNINTGSAKHRALHRAGRGAGEGAMVGGMIGATVGGPVGAAVGAAGGSAIGGAVGGATSLAKSAINKLRGKKEKDKKEVKEDIQLSENAKAILIFLNKKGTNPEPVTDVDSDEDPYKAGRCPTCGEYAVRTQRHIGAPVWCKNNHEWLRN